MSTPKRHHYVPQVILRNFANADGTLFAFDKDLRHEGIRKRHPTMVLREWHLYTSVSAEGKRDHSQEQRYNELETLVRPVLDKIIVAARSRRAPQLHQTEKRTWDLFLYEQWRRVPETHQNLYSEADWQHRIGEAVENAATSLGRSLSADEHAHIDTFRDTPRFRHGVLVGALGRRSQRIVGVLHNRGLVVGVAPARRSFAIGSKPIVRFRSATSTRLDDPHVEFWLPIAHDVIVSPGAADPTSERLFALDTAMVRKVNRLTWQQSNKVVAQSEKLLVSLLCQR